MRRYPVHSMFCLPFTSEFFKKRIGHKKVYLPTYLNIYLSTYFQPPISYLFQMPVVGKNPNVKFVHYTLVSVNMIVNCLLNQIKSSLMVSFYKKKKNNLLFFHPISLKILHCIIVLLLF